MSAVDPAIVSALIGAMGLAIGALFANLPKMIESTTSAGKARAEARRALAEAERIDAENDLTRAKRDRAEIVWLVGECRRLRRIIVRHRIDPNESEPLDAAAKDMER